MAKPLYKKLYKENDLYPKKLYKTLAKKDVSGDDVTLYDEATEETPIVEEVTETVEAVVEEAPAPEEVEVPEPKTAGKAAKK